MKYPIIGLLAMMLCLVSSTSIAKPSPAPTGQANNHLVQAYGQLPLSFEANQGQTDKSVQFLSRGTGYTLFLTPTEAVLGLSKVVKDIDAKSKNKEKKSAELRETSTVRMQLIGANASPKVAGVEELPGKINYLNGNDPKQWRTHIATYGKVKYEQVYPGIDLVYYGNQQQLEYDFIVAPGADPAKIQLSFAGQALKDKLVPSINTTGALLIGEVLLKKPVIYQEIGGQRKAVDGQFVLKANKQIGFQVAAYDKTKSLVIDPVLVYSTYLGTGSQDDGTSIAVDDSGQVYVTGYTTDSTFPLMNPLQSVSKGQGDVFITKLSEDGSSLIYSTYLGGSKLDKGTGIAIDFQGQAHVTGLTQSSNFPVVNPLQSTFKGVQDIFIAKLSPDGASLVYSSYLGGSAHDESNGIAVDFDGQAYVTGFTQSTNFPVANALQVTYGGGNDAFVTKLNTDGTGYIYSTYLGGDSEDIGFDVAVDSQGQAYVTGHAHSANFPVANALQATKAGSNDVFISKLTADGASFVYSTYLGGTSGDTSKSIAVDAEGQAYVTGSTLSSNFPLLNPFQAVHGVDAGDFDAFVTKINAEGTSLVYSTYLGGNKGEISTSIAVGFAGHAYVTGYTTSLNFPLVSPLQPAFGGGTEDIFITKLNPDGASLAYSTYLGGSSRELFPDIAVDSAGHAYVTGSTQSANFPLATPFQPVYGGGGDAFISKIVTDYALSVSVTGTGTIVSEPAGINCGENCSAPFIPNAKVTLTATPAANNLFDGWEGDCTGTGSCIVTMDEAKNVSAIFINPSIPTLLTVAKTGTGTGTITTTPAGIDCGAACTASYPQNKRVTLTATPAANALFAGWDGACSVTGTYTCNVSMDEAKTITAAFNPGIPLTVIKAGDGAGTVASDIPGIDCGVDCTEAYEPGAQVTLTAEPDTNSIFTGWTGACTGTAPCTVTLDTEKTVTATFKSTLMVLTVVKVGDGAVSSTPTGIACGADCTEPYPNKTAVTLTATPETDSSFTGWSGGCTGTTASCSVTMTAAKTVTATFKKIPTYLLTVSKTGAGSVISSPAGIDCGAVCFKSYNEKTVVALTATPDVGSAFDSWSGGGCTGKAACSVTMTAAQT
uniref:DUF7948 domain-containing protein n=1 Tax=Crenothrix polyspora TaxID=360316 RepID=UPI000B360824